MALADHRLDMGDAGMVEKRLERPPDDRLAANQLVLFRLFAPGAETRSPGHNYRRYRHHAAVAIPWQGGKEGP